MGQFVDLFGSVLLMDIDHHRIALIVDEFPVELTRAVQDRTHLLPREQIVLEHGHPQEHITV